MAERTALETRRYRVMAYSTHRFERYGRTFAPDYIPLERSRTLAGALQCHGKERRSVPPRNDCRVSALDAEVEQYHTSGTRPHWGGP